MVILTLVMSLLENVITVKITLLGLIVRNVLLAILVILKQAPVVFVLALWKSPLIILPVPVIIMKAKEHFSVAAFQDIQDPDVKGQNEKHVAYSKRIMFFVNLTRISSRLLTL
uniref:Uncharacterized protein n=1 Tax=Biomphalaria glabrata TaxID=6526 RepID=A0A2C9KMU0_BIOGL